jgi:hypothetical protein
MAELLDKFQKMSLGYIPDEGERLGGRGGLLMLK